MLILTDRARSGPAIHDYLARGRCCHIVDLQAPAQPALQPLIVCDVEVGDEASIRRLDSALARHRGDAGIPVLFLARDKRQRTQALARSLGATELVHSNAAPALILAAAERLIDGYQSHNRGAAGATEKRAADVKARLARCLDAARRREAIPLAELDKGAGVVLTAVKEVKIRKWLDVVRQFDDMTYQHCLLVAGLVSAFAVKLGLTPNHQRLLSQAALIHDVGKARVPQGLLNKGGPLTPAEAEVVRAHAALGHEMLAGQRGINPVILDVVRHHHEYCDGSGYPDRLRGPQITGYVRIATICDIYAALIERRAYKPPMPPQRAFAVLNEMGGKLDGDLLRSFEAMIADTG